VEQPLTVLCPAKVNLYLRVLSRRPDGYHDLDSVLHAIGLFDQLLFRPASELRLTCDAQGVPTGPDNLVLRAAQLLRDRFGIRLGAEILLRKEIPVQAGLGGGSSDAAGALIGLCRLWRIETDDTELWSLAAQLGSDVPFFLVGGAARISGRGENATELPPGHQHHLVIIKPDLGIPTASAYEQLDRVPARKRAPPFFDDLFPGMLSEALATHLHNDFEAVLLPLYPELTQIKQALRNAGCLASLLCGSGSAVFGLAPNKEQAETIASQLSSRWPWVRAATTYPYGALLLQAEGG